MEEEVSKVPVWKILFILMGVLVSLVSSITGFMAWKVFDVSDRVISIESSRCTSLHCDSMSNSITDIKARLEWYSERTITNANDIKSNTARISVLERQPSIKPGGRE